MARQAQEVLDLVEIDCVDIDDRVLLAVDRALLEGQIQLLESDLDRLGAHGLGVEKVLRRRREAHPQALEVLRRADGHVGGELSGPRVPGTQDVNACRLLEALSQRRLRHR